MITMMMECMQVEHGMVQLDSNDGCDNREGQCRELEFMVLWSLTLKRWKRKMRIMTSKVTYT